MRHLNLASLLIVSLAVSACGDKNQEHKTALQKTINPSRPGARGMGQGGCPKLDELFKRLSARTDGFLLHSYDYELVADAKDPKAEAADAATVTKLADFRALRGAAAPILSTSSGLTELIQAPPLDALFDVAAQKVCESVTFGAGYVFRVHAGDARTVTLINDETLETREYVVGENDLLIKQSLPQRMNECGGTKQLERTEVITLRLAWGDLAGQVKLAPGYATRLGMAEPTAAPEQPAPKATLRGRPAPKSRPRLVQRSVPSMPIFLFDKAMRDAITKAAALKCAAN